VTGLAAVVILAVAAAAAPPTAAHPLSAALSATAHPLPAAPSAAAHPLSASSRAAKAEVRLGEPFEYVVEVRHRPEERYALPERLSLAPFDIASAGCRREEAKGEVVTTCALRLALFALGPADVPALPLQVETAAGPAALQVPGPRITGVGVLDPAAPAESLRLRAPAPPVPLLVPTWRPVGWAVGTLAVAGIALLAWRLLRARRRSGRAAPAPLPPHERLARQLDALAAERLGEQGRGRELFFRLSAVVREHLGAVTSSNALDLTTLEIRALLEGRPDPRLDAAVIGAFLEEADVVKFAHGPAGIPECEGGMRFARELLRRTTPAAGEVAPSPRPFYEGLKDKGP
jgi:hypothetical protein